MNGRTRILRARTARVAAIAASITVGLLALVPAAMAWNGNLVVRKVNIGGPAGDSFGFTLTKSPNQYVDVWSPATKTFSLKGAADGGPFTEGATQRSFANLWAGYDAGFDDWVTYTVRETAKAGYRSSVSCGIAPDWNAALGSTVPADLGPWTFTPGTAGADLTVSTSVRFYGGQPYTTTCTFVNTYRARIRLIKDFDDQVSTTPPKVAMTLNGAAVTTDTGATTFGDGDASPWIEVDGGSSAAIAEQGTAGTALGDYTSALTCRKGSGAWDIQLGTTSGTLTGLEPGQDYECRFTNTRKPVETPPGPTPPAPTSGTQAGGPTPGTTPAPTPTTAASTPSARIQGATSCVRGATAAADVRGRAIARVRFELDGRAAGTLTSPNVAGMFRFHVPASKLRRNGSTLAATVRFKPGSGAKDRRLTFRLVRCPRRAGAPPFTG